MKKYLYVLGVIAPMVFSCETYDDLLPEQYNKIIYLKTSGEQDVTIYKTGSNSDYEVSIIKTGNDPLTTAQGSLELMSEAALKEYATIKAIDYRILPSNCYDVQGSDFTLTPEKSYENINVVLKTNQIDSLYSQITGEEVYVLPFILTSEVDSVNAGKDNLFVKPKVVTPIVSFIEEQQNHYIANEAKKVRIPLKLPIANLWDFTCKIGVDEDAVENGKVILTNYELANGGEVTFTTGQDTAWLEVTIAEQATMTDQFQLPLKIQSIEGISFELSEELFYLNASTELVLTTEMLSSNATEPTEGSLQNLLDNSSTTYFHSSWSVAIEGKHYVEVALPFALTQFSFVYDNRQENGNAAIRDLDVMVSSDGTEFSLLENFTQTEDGLPANGVAAGSDYRFTSPMLSPGRTITHVRFVCNSSAGGAFFVWSRLRIMGW